ncbi:MAG: thioredoxin-disulfide reductase [Ruthenibacterium sp.]
MQNKYDVIIIGSGPAGLAAGLYTGRARLRTLILEKSKVGGQIVITSEVENYPGGVEGDSGAALIDRMRAQTEHFGAEIRRESVTALKLSGETKTVICGDTVYESRAVILATGANPRPIGCPGERELTGKGVSYCATCDGAFFEDMDIYVVGGGDSAVEEALYLTRFGRRVVLIHRRDALRAAKSIQEKAFANPKIEFMWDSVVTRLSGEGILSEMTVKNVKTGVESVIRANEDDGTFGVFVFVGLVPNSTLFGAEIPQQNGYILTDAEMQTGIPGVYAAGDIRVKSLRQVATAVSDGAIAAVQAERYLEGL